MHKKDRSIVFWLGGCAILVFLMVVLGGVTRLTHSGLSMVEWQPLMGVIPPISKADWLEIFGKYKSSPEYQQLNLGMSLTEFKSIFYFEYAHRVLGRLIGLVFVVPLLVFWLQKRISRPLGISLASIFILGGLQGLLGWYMVQGGLVDEPRVSQYRLAAHLGLAAALFGALLWIMTGVALSNGTRELIYDRRIKRTIVSLVVLIYLMILLGGLVAGLRAGLVWNTFPLMGDTFIPIGLYEQSPWYLSAFKDRTTVQFHHRMVAYCISALAAILFVVVARAEVSRPYKVLVVSWCLLIGSQVILGILTLLKIVPVPLAALHQGVALLVFGFGIILLRLLHGPDKKIEGC
ncbi:MAG: COX15/CtaA family protein [Gammaproteobacteria bacterium]|nr:COX15/CtaA family protein [Gammaproteobacteria bacterium]